MTSLLDALGSFIEKADECMVMFDHDEDQIVAGFTDGLENTSRRCAGAKWTSGYWAQNDFGSRPCSPSLLADGGFAAIRKEVRNSASLSTSELTGPFANQRCRPSR